MLYSSTSPKKKIQVCLKADSQIRVASVGACGPFNVLLYQVPSECKLTLPSWPELLAKIQRLLNHFDSQLASPGIPCSWKWCFNGVSSLMTAIHMELTIFNYANFSYGFCDPSTSWTSPLCAWNSHLAGLRRHNVRDPDGCHITGSFAWLIPGRGQGLWCLARDVKHCELIHPGHDASDRVGRCWEVSQPRQPRQWGFRDLPGLTAVSPMIRWSRSRMSRRPSCMQNLEELLRRNMEKLWLSNQDVKTMKSCGFECFRFACNPQDLQQNKQSRNV